MQADLGGVGIHYRVDGTEGAPWLTFSNSLATDLRLWDAQVTALAPRFRILRYDTRGHGQSAAPAGAYSFDDLVGDLVGLWDHLGIARTHMVGLSLGGMTAVGVAIGHGERLASAAVCDARADAPPAFADAWDERIAAVREGGMAALVEPTVERWFTPAFQERAADQLERVREMIRATSADGYIGCARALQGLNYLPRMGEITVPTRFIVGKQDGGAPPAVMQEMHAAVADSSFVEIDPAGHLSNIENPAAFGAALDDFLPG